MDIEKYEQEKLFKEEEKIQVERELSDWEKTFNEENGRDPGKEDRLE